jgi:hypothetical protein
MAKFAAKKPRFALGVGAVSRPAVLQRLPIRVMMKP